VPWNVSEWRRDVVAKGFARGVPTSTSRSACTSTLNCIENKSTQKTMRATKTLNKDDDPFCKPHSIDGGIFSRVHVGAGDLNKAVSYELGPIGEKVRRGSFLLPS